ncbi:MAG: LL-diaminopimelate aminotransferase [Candidatus Geothermincolia bacterium]
MKPARRVAELKPYLFAEIDRKLEEKRAQGIEVISFGIGDPDMPTPGGVIDTLCEQARQPANHRYPSYLGLKAFRETAAAWLEERFGVAADPQREVLSLIGSKEGIAHLPLALVDPGDPVLIPDPAYPVYATGTQFAGGVPVYMPLTAANGFLPDLEAIPEEQARACNLIFLNYPNNPTAGVADMGFFERAVEFAQRYDLVIAHDLAYSEICFDGYRAPSILEVPGARERCIEFHSLSKSYNMTGWRIGFAVGGEELIRLFGTVKTNIDSGVFNPIQYAAIEALRDQPDFPAEMSRLYQGRRDRLLACLSAKGWEAQTPQATIYVWMRVPEGYTSASFSSHLLQEAAVMVAPGSAYGGAGEGYVRFSLSLPDADLEEGCRRLQAL